MICQSKLYGSAFSQNMPKFVSVFQILPCLQGEIIGNNMKQECLPSWFCWQASTAYQTPILSGKRILNCRSRHLVFVELFRTWHVPIDHFLLESILIRCMISWTQETCCKRDSVQFHATPQNPRFKFSTGNEYQQALAWSFCTCFICQSHCLIIHLHWSKC